MQLYFTSFKILRERRKECHLNVQPGQMHTAASQCGHNNVPYAVGFLDGRLRMPIGGSIPPPGNRIA